MSDGLFENFFGFIARAIAEARQQQAALAAEQERARAQFFAARAKFDEQKSGQAQGAPARVQIRRKQAPPLKPSRPQPVASAAPGGLALFQSSDDVLRAFVMAEVLGKPVALRDPSTFPPGAVL